MNGLKISPFETAAIYKNIPPDASTRCPLIHWLPGASSSAIAAPISSGWPTRPNAVLHGRKVFLYEQEVSLLYARQRHLPLRVRAFMDWLAHIIQSTT